MPETPELSPRTFGNEDRLPRVPLPTPEHSCARFLEWCTPLLDADQLARTEKSVDEFLAGPAADLHAELAAYDAQPGVASWLDRFWADRYLGRRDRIALNANFFFLFTESGQMETAQSQVARAANLVAAAVAYKQRIDDETLPPATARGAALSMEQNRYLFSATRIPGDPRDTARTPYTDGWPGPSTERHIVVLHRGRPVALDVIAPDGTPHTADEIAAGLQAVLDDAPERGQALGHLTTKARAEWAGSRDALLCADPANAAALDRLERALFCVCLEDLVPDGPLAASDQLLHGDSGNRWFDKSVSLVVFGDGTAGYNGEHCRLDGTTVIAFLDALLDAPAVAPRPGATAPAREPLEFVLDGALRADVADAGAAFAAYVADTATVTLSVDFSATRAKALRCSPDAFAQLAFQLAQRRARGDTGATYESIATRAFRHGRTEAMRVVTPAAVAFVETMEDNQADASQRRAAFRVAADAHVTRAKECQAGDAPEQHLWELQLVARRQGEPEPALYTCPGWTVLRDDHLSTSAVPSPNIRYWGFGSTSETCIGVGYAMLPDRFDLYLSTPSAVREQLAGFSEALVGAVRELEELLTEEDDT